MAGIQLTGLYSGMNWSNVISEIIQADSAPITELQATQTTNKAKLTSLNGLTSDMTSLQTAVQGLGDFGTNVFDGRTASMTDSSSTWTPSASDGTPTGAYTIAVSQLASAAQLTGAKGISGTLSSSSDVSGVTLANMDTAVQATAGTFTVDGAAVTVSLTDSLQDVFTAISAATGGAVTASYDPAADKVTLEGSSGPVVLGAANDTSNFLHVMGLSNNGTDKITSAAALGSASLSSPLATAGLSTALTGLDGSGNGSFTINGVTIDYNENTDSLTDVIGLINGSGAGVTASFDSQQGQMVLVNNITGDIGISASDTSGNLLSALGLTGAATLQAGTDAEFTVNGGPQRTATDNDLDATDLGVTGLAVTVNSQATQTVQVAADTDSMQTAIQAFITAYNQLQSDITTDTQITSANGSVTTSILSGNYEVTDWAEGLRSLAFASVSGLGGTIASLDDIGVGFTGTANQLSITDSSQMQAALANDPQDVAAFFQTGANGFASAISKYLNTSISEDASIQNDLTSTDSEITDQITVLQDQLNEEQASLTQEFTAMEDAVQQSQAEGATLSGTSSSSSSTTSSGSSGSSISSSAFSTPSSDSSSSDSSTSGASSSGTGS